MARFQQMPMRTISNRDKAHLERSSAEVFPQFENKSDVSIKLVPSIIMGMLALLRLIIRL